MAKLICPVCQGEMEECIIAMVTFCNHCGFSFTEIDACQLHATTRQEAAQLKHDYLIAQGWSPYPL